MIKNYDHTKDWFYEGNISLRIVEYLSKNGFEIKKDNSKNIKARGADIIAVKKEVRLAIEVKGYPTKYYVQGQKKGQLKKTNPKLQAKHWFSEAMLSSIFNYVNKDYDVTDIALCFPKFNRYLELIEKVEDYFTDNSINLKVYFVSEYGKIQLTNLNKNLR